MPPETMKEVFDVFGHEGVGRLYRFSRAEVADAYKSIHKKPLDPQSYGYQDVYDMLLSLPGISCGEQKDNESGPTKRFDCFEMDPPSEQVLCMCEVKHVVLLEWCFL